MSRHRIVRSMNYEDEYYDDEDEYSRSVEDNYCISPSTAAQFTWNREKNVNFASYMNSEEVIDEEDEDIEDDSSSQPNSLSDSANSAKLRLSEIDQAKLNSCLEEARNILGESTPESVLVEVIIQNQFNLDAAVNQLLTQQEVPKPQREPRQRKNRSQDDKDVDDLDLLLIEINSDKISKPAEGKSVIRNHEIPRVQPFSLVGEKPAESLLNSMRKRSQSSKVSLIELAKQSKENSRERDKDPNQFVSDKSLRQLGLKFKTVSERENLTCKAVPQAAVLKASKTNEDDLKFSQNMSSLSALVAQHSAQKIFPHSSKSDLLERSNVKLTNKACSINIPKSLEGHSPEKSKKPSFAGLIQAHSGGKTLNAQATKQSTNPVAQLTLAQLAEVHKKSAKPLPVRDKVTMKKETDGQLNTMSSLLKTLSLERMASNSDNMKANTSGSEKLAKANSSLDFSLSSCLRTSKSSKVLAKDAFSSFCADLKDNLDIGITVMTDGHLETELNLPPLSTLDTSLVSTASTVGSVLCFANRKRKLLSTECSKEVKKYSKFACRTQVRGRTLYKSIILQTISPFDFSTMSPDDIVRQKQKQAFTRSDKEFTV